MPHLTRHQGRTRVGGRLLAVTAATAAVLIAFAGSSKGAPLTQTFGTPGAATFSVPAGICFVNVTASGGQGGIGELNSGTPGPTDPGAAGATVTARVAVTPGQSLSILVGGQGGAGTFNTGTFAETGGAGGIGGGGGGAVTAGGEAGRAGGGPAG